MVLDALGTPLVMRERPVPTPGAGEILLEVAACGVCRTDLHVVDGELPHPKLPIVPGHEIVGRVAALGAGVAGFRIGERVGVPWLAATCGVCRYCRHDAENLCDEPLFTGYTRDGGYATHAVADARFCFPLGDVGDDAAIAPWLCAGLIGWRSYRMAGEGPVLGLYGFGAAAHILAQVAAWQGRRVHAFTRAGDIEGQHFARRLGAVWAGASDELPPQPLDAAIIFAPVGALVPLALKAVRKGGRVVCGGIHMSDIPGFPYRLLWEERQVVSVANLTRHDAREFLDLAPKAGLKTEVMRYPLEAANEALADLRAGRLTGAAVLVP
jgi:propanol-preferring alcohol dehydrogenase